MRDDCGAYVGSGSWLRITQPGSFTTGVPSSHFRNAPKTGRKFKPSVSTLCADFVAEVGDYYARGLPRFVDTSSYYAAFGER